jgi:hypothetical protein
MTSSILTYSGKLFDVLNPDPKLIDLVDISAALSKLCRFGGHCREFYSVAEHSILVSTLIQQEYPEDRTLAAWALMHDASEAYMVDIPRPVKRQLHEYVRMEDAIQKTIAERFSLPWPMPDEVHQADTNMLALELRAYMPANPSVQNQRIPLRELTKGLRSVPLAPNAVKTEFLALAHSLGIS